VPDRQKGKVMEREDKERRTEKKMILGVVLFLTVATGLIGGILIGRATPVEKETEKVTFESVEAQEEEVQEEPRTSSLVLDTRASGEQTKELSLAEILADRQVYFAGIDDVTISRSSVIYLENMPENEDILMQYEIVDKASGVTLETTGLIPAGESISWVPGEQLADGSYTLIFMEKPFYEYQGEYIALTQGNNEVNITIQS